MALDGKQLIQVVQDQGPHFVVEQAQQESGGASALILLIALVVLGIGVWQKRWSSAAVGLVICAVLFFIFRATATVPLAYRADVDSAQQRVTLTTLHDGKVQQEQTVTAGDLASADMAYSNAGGWVQFVRKDGQVLYPLGLTPLQKEPVQLQLVNRVRALIGTAPAP